jgi:hypothetical protein
MRKPKHRQVLRNREAAPPAWHRLTQRSDWHSSLHGQFFQCTKLGDQVSRLGVKHTDLVAMILVHEALEVRTAEFPADRGHPVPRSIFKAAQQDTASRRTAYCTDIGSALQLSQK